MKPLMIFAFASSGLLMACADSGANYTPILDGTPSASYQSDLAQCRALAQSQKQFDQETLGATALGAGIGAVVGEAEDDDALGGAIAGALAGGVAGAVEAGDKRKAILLECLRGRGHAVVG